MRGQRRDRRLISVVKLDRRHTKQHGDNTVSTRQAANRACIAIDQHERSLPPPLITAVITVKSFVEMTLGTTTDSFGKVPAPGA